MNPAPGYDPLIPHDMMHLVVEAKLGLSQGIFGQLAAGAGTFRLRVEPDESSRAVARLRRRLRKRGKKAMREGLDDCLKSERATHICRQAWLTRSQLPEQRGVSDTKEKSLLNKKTLNEIFRHLDDLSSRWSALTVGESMTVRWPDLKVLTNVTAPESNVRP
jgi:hypothetical protein